jgi:hypothetical protein
MKAKFFQIFFYLLTILFVSCMQKTSAAFDPTESLDFDYSSVLIEQKTTI